MRSILTLLAALLATLTSTAQDTVYVTTQDLLNLRAGPGQHWQVLAVVPHSTTLRAVGRTLDGHWIQVAYHGPLVPDARTEFTRDGVTYGWLWYGHLVWSGDLLTLPIDGERFVQTAREAGPIVYLPPGAPIYRGSIHPDNQTTSPFPHLVQVEMTGRIGESGPRGFWIQFKMQGQYYWVSSWTVGTPRFYHTVPDNRTRYAYGRLMRTVVQERDAASATLSVIEQRWGALASGRPTTCNTIPDDLAPASIPISESDLTAEPLFRPLTQALTDARADINAALARFRAVCGPLETRGPVSSEVIHLAQQDVLSARQTLQLLSFLIGPFINRDPTLGQ
jgi:hypothetical protein